MNKIKTIIYHDFKYTIFSKANILIFVLVLIMELMDSFPTQYNLSRLAYLTDQSYVVMRVMTQSLVILLLGIGLVTVGQFSKKIGRMKDILMTYPVTEKQIIVGKIVGVVLGTITISASFYCVIAIIQAVFNPGKFSAFPYVLSFMVFVIPAILFFVSSSCLLTLRIGNIATYFIMVVYVFLNISTAFNIQKNYTMFLFGGNLYSKLYQGNMAINSTLLEQYILNIAWYFFVTLVVWLIYMTKRQRWHECK